MGRTHHCIWCKAGSSPVRAIGPGRVGKVLDQRAGRGLGSLLSPRPVQSTMLRQWEDVIGRAVGICEESEAVMAQAGLQIDRARGLMNTGKRDDEIGRRTDYKGGRRKEVFDFAQANPGLTYQQIAEHFEVSRGLIGRYMRQMGVDRRPVPNRVREYAAFLNWYTREEIGMEIEMDDAMVIAWDYWKKTHG